jgi:hypothetical protein
MRLCLYSHLTNFNMLYLSAKAGRVIMIPTNSFNRVQSGIQSSLINRGAK